VTGDGRTSHIKVSHKLDMLGIGAANVHDPNGIAWKQNRDFENLLRRLNESADGEGETSEGNEGTKVEGFVSQGQGNDGSEEVVEKSEKKRKRKGKSRAEEDKKESESEDENKESRKKKRKKSEVEDGKKRNKKDKEHKSKKSKGNKSEESTPKALEMPAPTPVIPRHRA